MEFDRAKVVVLGDSGVGKSSFIHLLCYQQPLINPTYTIGCNLEVIFRQYRNGDKPYLIELWDVGGCAAHSNTRSVFYYGVHGIILTYDCTNRKSELNLRKWLQEFFLKSPNGSMESLNPPNTTGVKRVSNFLNYLSANDPLSGLRFRSVDRYDDSTKRRPNTNEKIIPVLVAGSKIDLLNKSEQKRLYKRLDRTNHARLTPGCVSQMSSVHRSVTLDNSARDPGSIFVDLSASNVDYSSWDRNKNEPNVAAEFGFPEILVNSNDSSSLAPGTRNAVALENFFDEVVCTRLSNRIGFGSQSPDSPKSRRFTIDIGQGPAVQPTMTCSSNYPDELLF